MKNISTECKGSYNELIWQEAEKHFDIVVRNDIKLFLKANNGGYPKKDIIIVDGMEYEVRVFLSLDKNDEHYCIERPLRYFLEKTKARIIPIGLDSGDNYYCVNNETGKVYYWSASNDSYYLISDCLEDFIDLFA
ncbi:MAG TPA: SMI1/KNR4 family protein [Candidatus Ornithomonoglobus merdipullorum]|uniref:SMI1/KNR4 family protein n=1 Tax=Candidatus Ornithomonoglobus merdipullorum TaxID=2840895 RepID=A0A9D1MDI8_9FIRM|nr:SMI1/KNR4 family protein [Candidatus Ornithomonoglobus merdipullorum]